jgi:galactitol-specific phosphotransferase system IIC component
MEYATVRVEAVQVDITLQSRSGTLRPQAATDRLAPSGRRIAVGAALGAVLALIGASVVSELHSVPLFIAASSIMVPGIGTLGAMFATITGLEPLSAPA